MPLQSQEYLTSLDEQNGTCAGVSISYATSDPNPLREAWHSLGDMTKSEAVKKYIAAVSSISPAWETVDSTSAPAQVSCMSLSAHEWCR